MSNAKRIVLNTRMGSMSARVREGGKSAILFLHGIGGNADSWKRQYASFDPALRVIGWDAPGYGESFEFAVESPAVEDYADAVIVLLDALNVERTHLVGHSLGGLIGACVAVRHPARIERLILSDCSSGHRSYDKEARERMLATRLAGLADGDAAAYARQRAPGVLSNQPSAEALEEAIAILSKLKRPGFPQASRMVSNADIFPFLPSIAAPTRVICGTEDRVTPEALNQKIAAGIAGADYVAIPGAGHWSFLEQPQLFDQAVQRFIQ